MTAGNLGWIRSDEPRARHGFPSFPVGCACSIIIVIIRMRRDNGRPPGGQPQCAWCRWHCHSDHRPLIRTVFFIGHTFCPHRITPLSAGVNNDSITGNVLLLYIQTRTVGETGGGTREKTIRSPRPRSCGSRLPRRLDPLWAAPYHGTETAPAATVSRAIFTDIIVLRSSIQGDRSGKIARAVPIWCAHYSWQTRVEPGFLGDTLCWA